MLDLFIFNHRVTSLRVVKVELCACCFVVGEWLWSFISYGAAVDPRRSIPIVVIFIPFICNHHDGWMRVKVGLKAFLVFMVPSSSCRVLTQRWKESLKSLKSVEIVEKVLKSWNPGKSLKIAESRGKKVNDPTETDRVKWAPENAIARVQTRILRFSKFQRYMRWIVKKVWNYVNRDIQQ